MGLTDLLAKLEQRAADTRATSFISGEVSVKPSPVRRCTPDTSDTPHSNHGSHSGLKQSSINDAAAPDGVGLTVTHSPEVAADRVWWGDLGVMVELLPGHGEGTTDIEQGELPEVEFSPAKSCRSCTHAARPGLGNLYCSGREDLPPAYSSGHPLRRLPEDGGVSCDCWRADQP